MTAHLYSAQKNKSKSFWLVFILLLLLLLVGVYCALRFGAIVYSHKEVMKTLGHPFTSNSLQDVIIDIRLPRVLAAALVGAAFAASGAIMQGVTRNPIADPGLLGINAGAGLALVIVYAFVPGIHYSLILLACFTGSVAAAFLVFGLSYRPGKGYSQLRLVLAGAMIAALFAAAGQAAIIYFDLPKAIIGWQAGGLGAVNWNMLKWLAPVILLSLALTQILAHELTVLSFNETLSRALGQKTFFITMSLLGIVLLLAASGVALAGTLGFVGLIIPHFARLFVSRDYRRFLPLISLAGAVFLVWVDLVSRSIKIPLGTAVSIIGVPTFLWLIRKERSL